MARLMAVPASIELWQDIVIEGWTCGDKFTVRCEEGLPEGAELVSSGYDSTRGTVILIFHHASFGDVPLGSKIPEKRVLHEIFRNDENA